MNHCGSNPEHPNIRLLATTGFRPGTPMKTKAEIK